jgi:hypothetical protein
MAKIYSAPKEIKLPEWDFANFNYEEHTKKEKEYKEKLKAHINSMGYNEKETGECIRIPHADSHAEYMILSLKGGVKLIHLKLGDAWNSEFAELLTAKKVKEMIARDKRIAEMFAEKRKENK